MWKTILEMINEGDLCALPVLVVILIYVGSAMTGGDHRQLVCGHYAAAGAFVLYFGYACVAFGPTTASDFIFVVIRAVLAGGIVLGPTWILAAVFNFTLHFVRQLTKELFVRTETQRKRRRERHEQRERELEAQRKRLEEERLAPQRERERQLAENRRQEAIQGAAKVQELRLQCEAHYRRHFAAVKDGLPETRFKELLDTHLPKDGDPAVATARGKMLIDMIDAVSGGGSAVTEFTSLQDLVSHFGSRRAELTSLGLEGDEVETLEDYIEIARDRAIERFLSR